MTEADAAPSRPLREFREIHNVIRRDIGQCRQIAADADAGAEASALRKGLSQLQTNGVIFQLRVNCLQACSFVHLHHRSEGATLFPSVRDAAPELSSVVDKLEADHREVSDMLDEVQAAAKAATGSAGDRRSRRRLVDALERLSEHLFEHLLYEEKVLGPVINRWERWPFYA
jgi:hypothetical protein